MQAQSRRCEAAGPLASMLFVNCRPHGLNRRIDCWDMQHSEELALGAALDGCGPCIGAGGLGLALELEDVDDALPYRLALERFLDRNCLRKSGRAAVHMVY